jgi:hypothetical protein
MNFLVCLAAVIVLIVASSMMLCNAYNRQQFAKESFFNFQWRPWRWHLPWYGHWRVPWYSGGYSHWQYPTSYAPWGPATDQTVVPNQPCSSRTYSEFHDRMRKYNDCKRCESRGQCVSDTASGSCGRCFPSATSGNSCEAQWGCPRSGGGYMPPVHPNLTGCAVCK